MNSLKSMELLVSQKVLVVDAVVDVVDVVVVVVEKTKLSRR